MLFLITLLRHYALRIMLITNTHLFRNMPTACVDTKCIFSAINAAISFISIKTSLVKNTSLTQLFAVCQQVKIVEFLH